jgi:glycolate oxidase FAD binding subunit
VSTNAVVAAIKEAGAAGAALRICGRSHWLAAGRPVNAEQTLSLDADSGVVSYVPGDLTLTVRAGTSLAEIDQVTSEHDQWLPLDPYGSSEGTIGATMATASAGPLATSFGLPRDLLLGLEFVNGRGDVVRAGGKVVKNVAGFDLSRLLTGSWGTLGVITEVTLRLYSRPKVDRTFAVTLDAGDEEVTKLLHVIAASPLVPFAFELLSRSPARTLGIANTPVCLIRLGGNAPVVDVQLKALSQIAKTREVEHSVWGELRELDRDAESVIRISTLPSRFLATSARMLADAPAQVSICISPGRGVMRLVAHANGERDGADTGVAASSFELPSDGGDSSATIIFEKLPADVWPVVAPSVVADPLSRGIKQAYDPLNILNPGILGD